MTLHTSSGERFDRVRIPEIDFENLILDRASSLMPAWSMYRWKHRVFTPDGRGAEADAILINAETAEWAVVEVELGRHSISGHIADQLDRLRLASYGSEIRDSVMKATGRPGPLIAAMLRRAPEFLCIADEYSDPLRECCLATGFLLGVVEPYRSDRANGALRVVRLPSQFREVTQSAGQRRWHVTKLADKVFGSQPYLLPDDFPDVTTVTIRIDEISLELKVTKIAGSRVLFDPAEGGLPTQGHVFVLLEIDAASGSFALARSTK